MNSLDAVDNFSVQFTGTSTTETDTFSLSPGASTSSTIAGEEVPSSATVETSWRTGNSGDGQDIYDAVESECGGCDSPQGVKHTFTDWPKDLASISVDLSTFYDSTSARVTVWVDGTEVYSQDKSLPSDQTRVTYSADVSSYNNADQYSIKIESTSGATPDLRSESTTYDTPEDVSVTVDGSSKSFSSQSSKSVSLDGDTSVSASMSATGGNGVGASISYEETSYSPNPSVVVNGETTSYAGTLAPGETATVNPPATAVNTSNTVTVQLGGSSDAPTPSVDMEYAHEAQDEVSVDYGAETWSERYNFSRYYASETDSASVTVPFKSDVLAVREVKYRVDGGSWVTVNDYALQNTTLTAQLGHVSAGSNVTVSANGSRVDVQNGSIQVTKPTTPGNTLATEFRVESAGSEFAIDVSGTEEAQYLHYLTNESWTAPAEYSVVEADGQVLYVPNVSAGATATARSYAMEVHPQNDVRVRLVEAGDTPEFDVGPATVKGDEVEFVLYGTASGEEYKLESLEDGKVWDKGTANSPVRLTMEDTHDSLVIAIVEALAGGDGSGGGGGVAPLVSTGAGNPLVPPYIMMGLGTGVLLLGGVVVSRAGVPVWVYAPVAALVGLVTVETLAPGAVSYTFAEVGTMAGAELTGVLGQVSAPLLLAGGGLLLWGAYRVINRLTRKQNVTLRLRRGR
ncbi:hypothetical protein [Haloplanus aerogenes]|uniref:Uncharacterized protein n=1 Tax=Haloplanus aerogenes TaxID=660522 RepID=A0A3G8QW84_9EURY|nr:hypothetical protein [Haloplanus aerogenes]AZH26833.1 hypothetical protein DU502_16275 [Haloplanus aerogenes]